MQEKIEVNEHTDKIVNAITGLMPSRNYIAQFLAMLPADFPIMYDAFPELLDDEKTRRALEMAFGVSFGEQVKVIGYSDRLGPILIDFYHRISKALENEDVTKGLSQLLGTDENIPNPEAEWLGLRLQGLMEFNDGQEAANVLKVVKETAEEIDKDYPKYEASIDLISKKTSVDGGRIHYVIDLLLKYKLIEKVNVTEGRNEICSTKEGIKFADSLKNHVEMIDSALK